MPPEAGHAKRLPRGRSQCGAIRSHNSAAISPSAVSSLKDFGPAAREQHRNAVQETQREYGPRRAARARSWYPRSKRLPSDAEPCTRIHKRTSSPDPRAPSPGTSRRAAPCDRGTDGDDKKNDGDEGQRGRRPRRWRSPRSSNKHEWSQTRNRFVTSWTPVWSTCVRDSRMERASRMKSAGPAYVRT